MDSLDELLDSATLHPAGKGFADAVIDSAHTEPQMDGSHKIVRFLAPTLAAAAGVAITLLIADTKNDADTIASEEATTEAVADTDVVMTELDSISSLLALESSSDISLVEDDELEELLF